MLKESDIKPHAVQHASSAGKRISVSLESFEQVRGLLAKFNEECEITFVVVLHDQSGIQIASSADPRPAYIDVKKSKGLGGENQISLVSKPTDLVISASITK